MRLFQNCQELMTETYRDLREMGHEVTVQSMQDKQQEFKTKEILNYSYCLLDVGSDKVINSIEELFTITQAKDWCVAEFAERINPMLINPGTAYQLRKSIWEEYLEKNNGKFTYSYNERMRDQLFFLINELKKKPNTRQAILSIWDPNLDIDNIEREDRVPCSLHYQFIIRNDSNNTPRLHCDYAMRSGDIATHFGNDVFLAILLLNFVAKSIGVKSGNLYHTIFSFHCYEQDWYRL